jgi:hypothetical protein
VLRGTTVTEVTTCPRCNGSLNRGHVTGRGHVCPHCAVATVREEWQEISSPNLASKIRRWKHAFWWVVAPLAVAGLTVVSLALLLPAERMKAPVVFWTGVTLAVSGLLVLLPLSGTLYSWWHAPSGRRGLPLAYLFGFLTALIVFGSVLVLVQSLTLIGS